MPRLFSGDWSCRYLLPSAYQTPDSIKKAGGQEKKILFVSNHSDGEKCQGKMNKYEAYLMESDIPKT